MIIAQLCMLLLTQVVSALPPGVKSTAFPPGWNGKARTPPLGWRSWNAYGAAINQTLIEANLDSLTAKSWTVYGHSGQVSLADLGYTDFGIDEGWEGCGKGVGGSQHDAQGFPVIDTTKFPDISKIVEAGHAKGLSMGWYFNGCACGEHSEVEINYEGDINDLHSLGFDAGKFDNCGAQKNMTKYAKLMAATGKNYTIENCHWGQCWGISGDPDANACPTHDWCPFNLYRTSGDVSKSGTSWLINLQSTIRFRDFEQPLSVPGCWAYPDMMEVGLVEWGAGWNRAHFGAWAISSSPLIIGAGLTDNAFLETIVPIVGNIEAIAVNQQWAGHPGYLVENACSGWEGKFLVAEFCDGPWGKAVSGFSYDQANLAVKGPGGCLDSRWRVDPGQLEFKPCDGSKEQQFKFLASSANASEGLLQNVACEEKQPGGACCLKPNGWYHWAMGLYSCQQGDESQIVTFAGGQVFMPHRPGKKCWSTWNYPQQGYIVQVWAKPQPNGALAVLIINSGTTPASTQVQLDQLRLPMTVTMRDIWTHTDNGTVHSTLQVQVPPRDSQFLLLNGGGQQVGKLVV